MLLDTYDLYVLNLRFDLRQKLESPYEDEYLSFQI